MVVLKVVPGVEVRTGHAPGGQTWLPGRDPRARPGPGRRPGRHHRPRRRHQPLPPRICESPARSGAWVNPRTPPWHKLDTQLLPKRADSLATDQRAQPPRPLGAAEFQWLPDGAEAEERRGL